MRSTRIDSRSEANGLGYMELTERVLSFEQNRSTTELSQMVDALAELGKRHRESPSSKEGAVGRAKFYEYVQSALHVTTYQAALDLIGSGAIPADRLQTFAPALREPAELLAIAQSLRLQRRVDESESDFGALHAVKDGRFDYLRVGSHMVYGISAQADLSVAGLPEGRKALFVGLFGQGQVVVVHDVELGGAIGVSLGKVGTQLTPLFIVEREFVRDGGTLVLTLPDGGAIMLPHARSKDLLVNGVECSTWRRGSSVAVQPDAEHTLRAFSEIQAFNAHSKLVTASYAGIFANAGAAERMVSAAWTIKDELAHVVAWSEEFARFLHETKLGAASLARSGVQWQTQESSVDGFNSVNHHALKAASTEELLARYSAASSRIAQLGQAILDDPRLAALPVQTMWYPLPIAWKQIFMDHIAHENLHVDRSVAAQNSNKSKA